MDFSFHNKNECPFHFPDFFPNPIQWNWSWKFGYFLKNFWRPFWAYLWLESKTMVFVRSSKVTNGWLVTIHDPESFIVTLQGYALQGYNGFLGVIHGYQFHWSLSRTLQMVHCRFSSKIELLRNRRIIIWLGSTVCILWILYLSRAWAGIHTTQCTAMCTNFSRPDVNVHLQGVPTCFE